MTVRSACHSTDIPNNNWKIIMLRVAAYASHLKSIWNEPEKLGMNIKISTPT